VGGAVILTLAILLATAVILVPVSRRLGFGSVLGYLVGGALIGPSGLRLITDVDEIQGVSELGIIMLLFLIGLEVRPQRLWVMRRAVFGLGIAQVAVTTVLLAAAMHVFGVDWPSATILGAGLALSSTAIVLPMLGERDLLGTPSGRDIFAVLLFQDLAFIPLVAAVPLLTGRNVPMSVPWLHVGQAAGAIAIILIGGRFLIRPAFRLIGGARTPEVFTALALFVVVGTAALADAAGLSMSLGAFLAGVLLSESEYRHEVQADVEPFEGLLLGFFFLSVGMAANLSLAVQQPWFFAAAVPGMMAAKIVVAFVLSRLTGHSNRTATRFAFALPQGSEFSFVLFAAAIAVGAMSQEDSDRATLAIALSMAATPLLFAASEKLIVPRTGQMAPPAYDAIQDDNVPVIICGFGRVGQIVGRVLTLRGIPYTALEQDSAQVEVIRRFGTKIYYGSPSRPDLLRAAGADHAKLLVVALENMEESIAVIDMVRRTFPNLKILARARNRRHAHLLMDRGIEMFVRETFHSSLRMGELALEALGVSEQDARRAVKVFEDYDERQLQVTHSFYEDEGQVIQSTKQAAAELAGLFEMDQEMRMQGGPTPAPPKRRKGDQTVGTD
jgi:monovalent cation:proton antiporter-2 (CPA2) family protein